jgi:hypothetical protein
MFSLLFHKTLPKCKNCIYYIPNVSSLNTNIYDLGKCKKFGKPYIYSEIERMDDLKCSIYGFKYEKKN